ncbi:MAG: hypothetical protein QW286_01810 [Candidatus Aenigmatarchaeota archaeon]
MGILDLFRKKKEPEEIKTEPPAEVHIDEIHEWVDRTLSGKINDRQQRANELYSDIMRGFEKIREAAEILERAKFDSKDKTGAVVNMTKELFAKRVHNLLTSVNGFQGKPIEYNVLKEFHKAAAEALADMESITPKQAYILSTYFSKESSAIIDRIKETQEKLSVMKEFLESEGETIQLAHKIISKKEQQNILRAKLDSMKKEESGIEIRIRELRQRTEKHLSEIESIIKGHEYSEYTKILERIEKNRRKSRSIEDKIKQEIYQVIRPLKKLDYLAGKNYPLLKSQELVLEGLINRPFETIIKNKEDSIREILLLLRKAASEEMLILKDSERQKVDELIFKTETDIRDMKAYYQELEDELKELERDKNRYEWIVERKNHLENSIKRSLEEIASLEKILFSSAKDRESIRKEMERHKQELEEIIYKTSGKKVSIVIPEEQKEIPT